MREQFRLCVYIWACVYLKISPFKMGNSICPRRFCSEPPSQEPRMPFPINPLAMVAQSLMLGALWGDPSMCLQGLKKNQIMCRQHAMCDLQMGLLAPCQGSPWIFYWSLGIIWNAVSTIRLFKKIHNVWSWPFRGSFAHEKLRLQWDLRSCCNYLFKPTSLGVYSTVLVHLGQLF